MAVRYNLEALNLPLELEEKILENLSSQLIQDAKTNTQHRALMSELIRFFQPVENNHVSLEHFISTLANHSYISLDNLPPFITHLNI